MQKAKAKTDQESGTTSTESGDWWVCESAENKLSSEFRSHTSATETTIGNFNADFKDDAHANKIFKISNIKVLYTNVRSITSGTKWEELQVLIKTEDVDVVGITETWGKGDVLVSEMEIPGFKLFRKDRAVVNDKKERSSTAC